MSSYSFLSPAEEEMTEAALFYESSSVGLGSDFLDDVQTAIKRVSAYPHSGESIHSSFRRTLLHRFPFSLIYVVERHSIVIVAVAHHGRAPGYWHSRVK
jgi:plasmid stabilization system protein ParE